MTQFSLKQEDNTNDDKAIAIESLVIISKLLSDAYEGRVKPDNKGDKGTIRESLDNMPFIKMLQAEVGSILGTELKKYE